MLNILNLCVILFRLNYKKKCLLLNVEYKNMSHPLCLWTEALIYLHRKIYDARDEDPYMI